VTERWRLVLDGPCEGVWNMAVDRAIQRAQGAGLVPPTIRLYRWSRPTISLGKFQNANAVDWEACEEFGVDVVRRFTGGRGVLHDDELTYSIVASISDGVPRGTSASYRHLCAALVAAYRRLGVQAELTERHRGSASSPACYLHATKADLSVDGAKLAGSAQTWLGDTVLQHGSLTVSRDVEREAAVFGLDDAGREALESVTWTFAQAGVALPSESEFVSEVSDAMAGALGVSLVLASITPGELDDARTLQADVQVKRPGRD